MHLKIFNKFALDAFFISLHLYIVAYEQVELKHFPSPESE